MPCRGLESPPDMLVQRKPCSLKLGSANFLSGADLSANAGSAQNSGSHFQLEAEFL